MQPPPQRRYVAQIISGSRQALLIGSIGPRGKRQRAGRPRCRLGQVLSALALLLQTALPGLHTPVPWWRSPHENVISSPSARPGTVMRQSRFLTL